MGLVMSASEYGVMESVIKNKTTLRLIRAALIVGCTLIARAQNQPATAIPAPATVPNAEERIIAMSLKIGSNAPDFNLPDASGKATALKDFKGKWTVLYFYPKDDTPGCTTEACEFTSSIADFKNLDAQVVGVSPDKPEKHQAFIEKYKLAVTLLSDPGHKVMESYGAWGTKVSYGKETVGVIRSTTLIDPQGKVAFCWPKVNAKGHAAEVKAKLEALRGQ